MDLSRVELVIGQEALNKIKNASVAVIGLGGVGSYVAEALARSGVGHLLLIDADVITMSNINRQLPALISTQGIKKVDVVRARLQDINHECKIDICSDFYQPGDFEQIFYQGIDFIADAIDSVDAKVDLIISAQNHGIPIISALGTGNKLDPSHLCITDISKTHTCPLAKAIRTRLRKFGVEKGLQVVFSDEEPKKAVQTSVPGSMVFVPASAGLLMASYIIRKIIEEK